MHTVHKTPAVTVTAKATRELSADLLIIPVFEDDDLADEAGLDRAAGGEYTAARRRGEFKGKAFEQLCTPIEDGTWKSRRVLLVGAGRRKDFSAERLRRIATSSGLTARQRRLTNVAIASREVDGVSTEQAVQALAEGAVLANYEGGSPRP